MRTVEDLLVSVLSRESDRETDRDGAVFVVI